jgi:YebC/PmpR family DNA-binding regulatory protein
MPNDNIERSIKRAAGELGDREFKELTYEGYGVAGSAVIITTLTDNNNRTAGDVRAIMSKHGGSLGMTGCVSYMFSTKGVIIIERTPDLDEDTVTEYAIEAGAEDVVTQDDVFEVYTEVAAFSEARKYLEEKGLTFLQAEITMIPQSKITLPADKLETFLKMLDKLEENDDVKDIYHNVELPEEEDED